MVRITHSDRGYSLIELLVVLAIAGILVVAGVFSLRPRTTDSVRSVMSELEGFLLNVQHSANLSPVDTYLGASGNWIDGSLIIDGRPFVTTGANAVAPPPTAAQITPGGTTYRIGSPAECFRSLSASGNRDHLSAGIDTTGAWYTTALGSATALAAVAPVSGMANFTAALATGLCQGGQTSVVLDRINHQFVTGFCIVVVGLTSGNPVPNGPIGVIVVPAGGANIYKYFKADGQNTWRRL